MPAKDLKDHQSKAHDQKHEPARPVIQSPEIQSEKVNSAAESLRLSGQDPGRMSPNDILVLQESLGNRAVSNMLDKSNSALPIQAKLTVGAANDAFEQEADRAAEQVMRMPETALQREAAPEEEEPAGAPGMQRSIAPDENNGEAVQVSRLPKDPGSSFEVQPGVEDRIQNQRGGGQPLPGELRDFMEPRFGADFSKVRLHSGSEAINLNREVKAEAFTTGQEIFLGGGVSDLTSGAGKRLLAHELAHSIQQGASPVRTARRHADPGVSQGLTQQELIGAGASRKLQRHPQGEELKEKDAQVGEVSVKENSEPEEVAENAPETTRTKKEEATDKKAGKEAGKSFQKSQKLTPGAMSLASAEKILQGAYGGIKKIVPGSVVILADQPACSRKYDEVCIADGIKHKGVVWKLGDNAKDDAAAGVLTQGFAWKGVVYVNGQTTLVTATAHEILHNNTEPKFRARVGETFNEGVTETLARQALKDVGIKVPSVTAYPTQVDLTKMLVDLVGIDVVKKGYFEDVEQLVTAFESKGSATWAELFSAGKALDKEKVKTACKPGKKGKKWYEKLFSLF